MADLQGHNIPQMLQPHPAGPGRGSGLGSLNGSLEHSLNIFSQLFDQFDVDVGLQQSGTNLLQHGVQHLDKPTDGHR